MTYSFVVPTLQRRKLSQLPKVMWLVRNGDKIQTQSVKLQGLRGWSSDSAASLQHLVDHKLAEQ